jgi:plastocyanin
LRPYTTRSQGHQASLSFFFLFFFIMRFSLSILAFPAIALAAVHEVDVGEDGLVFDPKTLTAAQGDTVIFKLYPKHNVAQGAFNNPCQPNGFFSGTFDTTDNGKKRFVVNITSTDPIYYYCAVPTHCKNGMVGGINLPYVSLLTNCAQTALQLPRGC